MRVSGGPIIQRGTADASNAEANRKYQAPVLSHAGFMFGPVAERLIHVGYPSTIQTPGKCM